MKLDRLSFEAGFSAGWNADHNNFFVKQLQESWNKYNEAFEKLAKQHKDSGCYKE